MYKACCCVCCICSLITSFAASSAALKYRLNSAKFAAFLTGPLLVFFRVPSVVFWEVFCVVFVLYCICVVGTVFGWLLYAERIEGPVEEDDDWVSRLLDNTEVFGYIVGPVAVTVSARIPERLIGTVVDFTTGLVVVEEEYVFMPLIVLLLCCVGIGVIWPTSRLRRRTLRRMKEYLKGQNYDETRVKRCEQR